MSDAEPPRPTFDLISPRQNSPKTPPAADADSQDDTADYDAEYSPAPNPTRHGRA